MSERHVHRVLFTRDVFAPSNDCLAHALAPESASRNRVQVFVDAGLCRARPELVKAIASWFSEYPQFELVAAPVVVPGGEIAKNDSAALDAIWQAMADARLCRHSRIVAIGGGAVLDAVGFAAATAHRGIPLVRLPTTSLSQADGGVGVKNAVNRFGRKNWLGCFTVPLAVVNDLAFLDTLPPRERRAGLIEAAKVALIRDARFFDEIARFAEAIAAFEREPYERTIRESARQHVEHIATAGDPFERGSARPLDFGHWAAHKLEQMSGFELSHAEAVAVGMALDLVYARFAGLLAAPLADRILGVTKRLGFNLYTPLLERQRSDGQLEVLGGLEEFREHMGGELAIPMIRAPGERVLVNAIDSVLLAAAVKELRTHE
ncbi:3-dehydroquinate synthase [Opitutaceae bacterium EW11]|nr:3-dehydroquinate synthase [Opitutaceae bacterium EW11]